MDIVKFKENVKAMIGKGEFALPSNVDPMAFGNAAIIAFQTNPQLRQCSPESVFTALRHLAGMGLVPDGREAAIVVYNSRDGKIAQAQPMVSGLRKVARNSGQIAQIFDDVVYEGETIIIQIEAGRRVWNHVNEDGHPINAMTRGGKIIGAYAAAVLKDGSSEFEPMSLAQIEKRRRSSPNQKGEKPTGVWGDWYEEMARKTAVRALCRRLPMSSEDYNRIVQDPTFQEVEAKDVTPQETTHERLKRIADERATTKEDPPVEAAAGADHPAAEGAEAFRNGMEDADCPYQLDSEEADAWLRGWGSAAESVK